MKKLKLISTHKLCIAGLSFLLVWTLSLSSTAQNITATAAFDTNSIKIGQQVKLLLNVTYNANTGKHISITWPQINDTLTKQIEVVNQSKVDTIIADSSNLYRLTQTQTITITCFDSGSWVLPPLKFLVDSGTISDVYTQPLVLNVSNVAIDTTLAIKDIKPVLGVNYSWIDWIKDNVYQIIIAVALLVIVILIIYYVRKRLKNKPIEIIPEQPKLPAHIIALERLDKLKNEKLWQEGKIKQYYILIAEIVREYIENRYKIQALEQTTDEIILALRSVAIDEESKNKLKQLLVLSDLVKFAKEHPLPAENELSLSNAYDFVNGTKKEEEEVKK